MSAQMYDCSPGTRSPGMFTHALSVAVKKNKAICWIVLIKKENKLKSTDHFN